MRMGGKMIEVRGVQKSFSNQPVLKNINLTIEKGEIFGIVGESGAGKSTLLRCMNGLESYDKGSIKVIGKEVKSLRGKEMRKFRKDIGVIFQGFNLLNRKNVFDNVALPMEIWKYDKGKIQNKVSELLKLVGLEDKIESMPRELSGGQKQRVAIARALTLSPKILLCDEATSSLDPNTTNSILNLLNDINQKLGITIVIITHQMEVIKKICTSAALIEDGSILSQGRTQDLFLRPDKNLKKLIGETEMLPQGGINIRIFFPPESSQRCIITSMAREMNIDFSIVWGKLENFGDSVLGSLVINADINDKDKIVKYLDSISICWEVLD